MTHAFTAVLMSALALGGAPAGELLDFSATWCGPCQQMAPLVDRLARQGYPIRKVDVDQNQELVRRYGVVSIPAFVLVINGKIVQSTSGIQSEAELKRLMAMIPRPAPEFDDTRSPAPVMVDNRGTIPRDLVTLVSSQPSMTSITAPRKTETPKNKTNSGPGRGLLGLNLLGRVSGKDDVPKKSLPAVVRANLDDDPPALAEASFQNDPLSASTRLRISDRDGTNVGTGTIIESKVGRALILTCGHLFRNYQSDSVIEVDVFLNGKVETFVGKAVKYDFETDTGLISIPSDNVLPTAEVAGLSERPEKGAAVESVGCGHGNNPTLQKHLVTRLNRYTGPENIECTGVPVQGRSGGGLFNRDGRLIGICMAADTKDRRGLYVGLSVVQQFLKSCRLDHLAPQSAEDDVAEPEMETPEFEEDSERLLVKEEVPAARKPRGLAALQEALGQDDAEVICLVRSDRSSQANQRVVVVSGSKSSRPGNR